VPAVIEIGSAFGGAYAISERHDGIFLDELDYPRFARLLPALLRALDAMRALPVPTPGPVDWAGDGSKEPETWHHWLVRTLRDTPGERVSGWQSDLERAPGMGALYAEGEAELHALLGPCPQLRHVLHLDLFHRNVLVNPDGSRLAAVFDWGCSVYGDFLYEVACLSSGSRGTRCWPASTLPPPPGPTTGPSALRWTPSLSGYAATSSM